MIALALALATTIKHDGHGGVADLLSTPEEATAWLADHQHLVTEVLGPPRGGAAAAVPAPLSGKKSAPGDEFFPEIRGAVLQQELAQIRRAVRALFARAVAPRPASTADADRLMDVESALRMVNDAAALLGTTQLDWPADDVPLTRWGFRTADPVELLIGAVARSTIDFLVSPDRERLRACPAARCVKYFLQDDPRQTWCSPSCGNRERVNRHYRKRTAG